MIARFGGRQIFLFGPTGTPFWAARAPVSEADYNRLDVALALLERTEQERPRPFFAHDAANNLVVAALDEREDLYVVVLHDEVDPAPAEMRVGVLRQEFAGELGALRKEIRLATSGS
jgi:hypothetical protein